MSLERTPLMEALEAPLYEYWTQLGRFVHEFSRVEFKLQMLLRHLSGVPHAVGPAIFSDTRYSQGKDAVNRILDATGNHEAKERLAPTFVHLSEINGIRNKVVHWGAAHDGGETLLVTNARLAITPDRVTEFRISASDLKAMSDDLFYIGVRFQIEIWLSLTGVENPNGDWREVLELPWTYKPRPPSQTARDTNPARGSKRRRQPRASPKSPQSE